VFHGQAGDGDAQGNAGGHRPRDPVRPARVRLRDHGFSDIAEGTVYALLVRIEQRGLVDVEKIPSEKGPPRKVYSLNAQGREYLEEFWRTWSFLTERLEQLHEGWK
jgi:PadR family transcriptional regulator, regulatory protein PadR